MEFPAGMEDYWECDDDMVFSFDENASFYDNDYVPESNNYDEIGDIAISENLHVKKNRSTLFGIEDDFIAIDDLRIASKTGNIDSVKSFIEKGVDVDIILKNQWTALMYACSAGQFEIVEYLLQNGADPNFHKDSFTPLMAVCASTIEDKEKLLLCTNCLLKYGAKLNVKDKHNMSPLHFASREYHYQIAQKLVECGSDIDAKDNKGWTALMWASFHGNEKIVKLLLDNYADSYVVSIDGETASDLALARNHHTIIPLLEPATNAQENKEQNKTLINGKKEFKKYTKYDDLEVFLTNLNFADVIPLFNERELTFKNLLTMNEKELEEIGINRLGVRKRIIREINTIHKVKWQMSSLPRLANQQNITSFDIISVMANAKKQLSYIEATIVYLRQQIKEEKMMETEDAHTNANYLIRETENCLKNSKLLANELKFLKNYLDKIKGNVEYNTSDLIKEMIPSKYKSWQFVSKFLFFATMGITTGILWKYPLLINIFLKHKISK